MADPLGIVFDQVFPLIKKAAVTIYTFRSLFRKIEATFVEIEPIIKDMDSLNKILDRPGKELAQILELMKEGETLLNECSKVGWANVYKRLVYSRKLNNWDEDVKSFFDLNLRATTAVDVKRTLVKVEEIGYKVDKLGQGRSGTAANSGGGGGYIGKYVEPEAPAFVVGMGEQYEEVKSKLLQDGFSVVVVSGPGGCGKTTLVDQIFHDPKIKDRFKDNAFYFKVSESFDAVHIIQEMLHIKHLDASIIKTEDDAFKELKSLLHGISKNPILLVLDDVWSKHDPSGSGTSESDSPLEKFVLNRIPNFKILVTSRFEFPRFGSPVRLGSLKREDAVEVFLHAATPLGRSNTLPDNDLINAIVKCCKGSPLALTVIGKSLCGCRRSIWESKLLNLSKDDTSILDWDSKILNCLSKSLDDLNSRSEIKDCFFDLAFFPEDHKIHACALIDIWTELYNLDAEVHAMALLQELSNRSLVDLAINRNDEDEYDNFYEEHFAMQHDLLRQLAIRQSSQDPRRLIVHIRENAFPKWWVEQAEQSIVARIFSRLTVYIRENVFPKWWVEQTEQPIVARILSISTDEKFSSEWLEMEVPAVEVVVLNFRAQNQKYTLPQFMGKMSKLKVMIVANNSFLPAELTNFSLLASLSCLKKIRLERIRIPFLPMANICLENLEKLTLFMCEISKDVLAANDWNSVAFPKLLEVNVLYCKNLVKLPAGLCDVTSLRKLSITNCPDLKELPQSIGNLRDLEILRLNGCTNLQHLPTSIGDLRSLELLDISDCIGIEELPDSIGELHNLKEFHMKGRLELSELPSSVANLHRLTRVTCHEVKAPLWKRFEQNLTELKVDVIKEKHTLDWLRR